MSMSMVSQVICWRRWSRRREGRQLLRRMRVKLKNSSQSLIIVRRRLLELLLPGRTARSRKLRSQRRMISDV